MEDYEYDELEGMYRQHLQDVFNSLIKPAQLTFRDDIFMRWLEYKSVAELEYALKLFEEVEMYEECAIILDHLKSRNTRD